MKIILISLFFTLIVSCNQSDLAKLDDSELIDRIANKQLPDFSEIEIRNGLGETISFDSLKILEFTGEYFEDFYVNHKDEVVKLVIRNKTDADEILLAKINEKLNEGPEVKIVDINCEDKISLLNKVYDRDQGMRRGAAQFDPSVDHENLEIIISFIEKCGIPTLNEINDTEMSAIWLTLQHASPRYQKLYIPELEEAAKRGDIEWAVISLMKDRSLMHEGKPQIYGSQIRNGLLYELFEPKYVNQRRTEIGMEPIEEYLKRFGIEFQVEQLTK